MTLARIRTPGRRLVAMDTATVTLDPVHPNEGIRVAYQRRIDKLVSDMTASVMYWLRAEYKANEPEMAQDASPAMELRREVRKLSRRWQRNFDQLAPELAEYFAKSASNRSDTVLKELLRKRGFSVRFKVTAAQNDAYQAIIGENIALIKSIPVQYLTGVEGSVMRAVQNGRSLGSLAKELEAHQGITARRAAFIARDQNNKATAVLTRVRQTELGITEAVWMHTGGGKKPRPEHVAFSGQRYNVATGAFLEGKWTWPGVEIGCRCVGKSIIPGF